MTNSKAPCLQELVARFGRFDLISCQAWEEHDRAVARWRIDRLITVGLRPVSPEEMKERRRRKRAAKNHAQPPGAGYAVGNANAPPKQEDEMDMSQYAGSSFLKPEHLTAGPRTETITDVQEGGFGRPELTFESGDKLSVNVTNTRVLLRAFGANDADWLGKMIEISAGETTFKDQIVPTIIVKPISPPVAKEAQQPLPALRDEMDDEIPSEGARA
jgi:hypothetical protein